ncbi:Histone_acetyltransferase [Hexamita inflata]|uniref:Histone acetyltransferase n=1 Tax=Hexamita inflata TaxID=28002 RepID=A0AA86QX10_9EUKA|nr:Histone acetyltransferase [Hexamita inflata]
MSEQQLKLKDGQQYIYYKCACRASDNEELVCRLLKSRDSENGLEYYVQFMDCNSRVDDWYLASSIKPLSDEERISRDEQIRTFVDKPVEVRSINRLHFGGFVMDVWYYVPLTEELQHDDVYCCEFCLNFINNKRGYDRHLQKCTVREPPGTEIYRDDKIIFYEIDGQTQKRYCRNISYVARMFLQHKTLEIDVDIFNFYVMYAKLGDSYRLVGYFSKEKPLMMPSANILSCILTLPCYQSQGFGSILIDMSYMLASRDNLIGSPEKPLSDLGYMAFSRYWKHRIFEYLTEHDTNSISIADIVKYTNFTALDIQQTMRQENCLFPRKSGDFVFYVKDEQMSKFIESAERQEKKAWRIQDKYLHYFPCSLLGREYKGDLDRLVVWVKQLGY